MHTTKSANKVDVVKELMTKYETSDFGILVRGIMKDKNTTDLDTYRSISLLNNFRMIKDQAVLEMKIEKENTGYSYLDHLITATLPSTDCMTVEETAVTFRDWCKEQNIQPGELLLMICIILGKYDPMKNCLMLQGGSNAGKTYWSTALAPIKDVVGGTINSTDFTFQICLDKELIIIPELSLTKPEQMEELKQVMEGYPILANIKNKEPRILK